MSYIITDSYGNSFQIGDYIEKGSFSKVYSLECYVTKKQYAGKFINKEKLKKYGLNSKVYDEIRIHQKLRHRNIVQFLTYIEQRNDIIIVLEYCSKYSMVHVMHALKKLNTREAKYFMIQVVSAVEYLHSNQIVHRDLKLGNLFVNKDLEIKLGDFGLAVVIEYDGQRRFSRCGTPNYIAPEVIGGTGHSFEVDVWALGCILHTMLEGTPPFQGQNTADTYNNILRCEYHFSPNVDSSARVFIMSSLQADPRNRPNVFQLAKFDFITSRKIHPEPPQLNFGDNSVLSSALKRKKDFKEKCSRSPVIKDLIVCDTTKNNFVKLTKWLASVPVWPDTDMGEFLSENASAQPLVWVNAWMDYTNSYGFVYQLNNKNVGLIFNDLTRMLIQSEEQYVHYVKSDGSIMVCKISSVPNNLKKKFKILEKCGKYMNASLLKAHEKKLVVSTKETTLTTEVQKWTRTEEAVVMFLSNGSVQVNFVCDHTKFILCGFTKTVTVMERNDCMRTLKLESLQMFGCSQNLKEKLSTISSFVKMYVSGEI